MNNMQIANLKMIIPQVDGICFHLDDYIDLSDNLQDELCYSPFGSDMMLAVIKRGCMGRFYFDSLAKQWGAHCFIGKSTKLGHIKLLCNDVSDAIWKTGQWTYNFSLDEENIAEKAINKMNGMKELKTFW